MPRATTSPTANNLVLQLATMNKVPTIQILDNGALVAADPLATTANISINCGDFAANSLTVDFTGGNPIPLGGLTFNGTAYQRRHRRHRIAHRSGTIARDRRNAPHELGPIVLRRLGHGSATADRNERGHHRARRPVQHQLLQYYPAHRRHDSGHQRQLHALGSNNNDVLLTIGPTVNGVQSTQFSSSGVNIFHSGRFHQQNRRHRHRLRRQRHADPQFQQWQSAAGHRSDFQRRNGHQSVQVTGGGNFTLGANATITNTTLGGGGLSLINEQNVSVTGGPGDQYFTVTNWLTNTGQPLPVTINGGGGHDQIYVRQKPISLSMTHRSRPTPG